MDACRACAGKPKWLNWKHLSSDDEAAVSLLLSHHRLPQLYMTFHIHRLLMMVVFGFDMRYISDTYDETIVIIIIADESHQYGYAAYRIRYLHRTVAAPSKHQRVP